MRVLDNSRLLDSITELLNRENEFSSFFTFFVVGGSDGLFLFIFFLPPGPIPPPISFFFFVLFLSGLRPVIPGKR